MKQDLHIGVVASLHSLSLLDACCREDERIAGWETVTCPGYGSLVRQMRGKRVDAALLPLDWFATHFLNEAQEEPTTWKVIQAWPQCALEFWMCRHLKKRLARHRRVKASADRGGEQEIRVAVEAASPLMVEWVTQRLTQINGNHALPLKFQHLPVRMMPAGIKAGLVDAMVAPAPWSHAEELTGEGSVDGTLLPATHDLGLVLVVDQESEAAESVTTRQIAELSRSLPGKAFDPRRLSCSHHAALSVRDPDHIGRQFHSLPPPVPQAEMEHWLQDRLTLLRNAKASGVDHVPPGSWADLDPV